MINDQSADSTKLSGLNAQFIRNFITNDVVSHNEIIHIENPGEEDPNAGFLKPTDI